MYRKRKRKDNTKLKIIVTAIIFVVALSIILLIIFVQPKKDKPKAPVLNTSSLSSKESSSSQNSSVLSSSIQSSSSQNAVISSANSSSSQVVSPVTLSSGYVPPTVMVDSSYLSDALFIGDSITQGIDGYNVMPNTNVFAKDGISLNSVYTIKILFRNAQMGVLDAVTAVKPAKVYLLFGINEMGYSTPDQLAARYQDLIAKIRAIVPNTVIYIQSITPVSEKYEQTPKNATNQKIDTYNQRLIQLTNQIKVYYLNIAEIYKDPNGKQNQIYSGGDGLHINFVGYKAWMDYVLTHTVK